MGYLTLLLEYGDIQFDGSMRLQMIDDVSQSFKVLLETQFESDFRKGDYGFKLQELMESEYSKKDDLISLYIKECLIQHPDVDKVLEIEVIKLEDRKYEVNVKIQLKSQKELTNIEGVIIG